jgi:NO-binding membrane sensor protein with MHYT domain
VASVHHFAYGWVTPALAYLLSYLGSLSGLAATARARRTDRGRRARWLVLAAWSIGGTGIWAMHFMAMIGFTVDNSDVRYDVPITIASWLTAVVVVGLGLFIVGYGRRSMGRIVIAGVLTGVGVAGMHYAGMDAMRLNGTLSYDRVRVGLSVLIAVVAATVALWFTVSVRRPAWIAVAAAVMGVAVVGMHYTGMAALSVHLHAQGAPVTGVAALNYLVPMLVFVLLVVLTLVAAVLSPSMEDNGGQPAGQARPAPAGGAGGPDRWGGTERWGAPGHPGGGTAGRPGAGGRPGGRPVSADRWGSVR